MAKSDSTRRFHRPRGPVICLTPKLFAELDAIARAVAGNAIEVKPAESMPNMVGRVHPLVGCGYKDSRVTEGVCMTDLSTIEIANRIDCEQVWSWATTRPELDYSKIPAKDMYRFVVWHEIGHRARNLHHWDAVGGPVDLGGYAHDLWWINEVRADRYAWEALYPGKRLPRTSTAIRTTRQTNMTMKRLERLFPRRPFNPRPLPIDPHLMVPASHVRSGIPWSEGLT